MDNGSGSVPLGPQSPAGVPCEATSVNVGVSVEVPLIYPLEIIGQVMLRCGARAGLPGPGGARRGGAILPSCSGCPLATMQPGDAQTQLRRGFLHCRGAGKAHSRSGSGQAGMQSTSWLQGQGIAWVWATSCSHPRPHTVGAVEEGSSTAAETPSCSGKGPGTPGHGHGRCPRSLPTDSCPLNHPHLSSGARGWLLTALPSQGAAARQAEPELLCSPLAGGPAGQGGRAPSWREGGRGQPAPTREPLEVSVSRGTFGAENKRFGLNQVLQAPH